MTENLTKAELEEKVKALQTQLLTATHALENLQKAKGVRRNEQSLEGVRVSPVVAPPAKSGYLFKELDRAIGWGGIKWSLRHVVVENGRLSYYSNNHANNATPNYQLQLLGCGVRDDGWKKNPRFRGKSDSETGAYFYLFSIYQRPENDDFDETEITPLMRFSTPSKAQHENWVKVVADTCAYCETEEFASAEAARAQIRVQQQQEEARMVKAMPEVKRGTLPPLYFAAAPLKRTKSMTRTSSRPKLFRTRSKEFNADQLEAKSTKGYPPSKPMHREAEPSYLSFDAADQNYRGFLNLGIIILVVSNFRLILGTVRSHGFVLGTAFLRIRDVPTHWQEDPWRDFPFITGLALNFAFLLVAYLIESGLCHRPRPILQESLGMSLHHINAHSALLVPLYICWNFIDEPAVGAVLLLHATITWMKLVSYVLANEDYRTSPNDDTLAALVKNLDNNEESMQYPDNVTLRNILYFWCAPTLTYQIAFPKSPHIRIWKLAAILFRIFVCVALSTFLVVQVVSPALSQLVTDLEATNGTYTLAIMGEYWLKLTIANTYLWLLMFYAYFHLYLNFFAEILRFGDRVFYKDWWNASEVSAYWRLWNMPVHYWLIRHIYFPCVRLKMGKMAATFCVFFLSAIMHEVLVSVPFHMVRPWSFIGMMMQIPLVALTRFLYRKYPGSSIGNILFWMSFCIVGQPMAILLYTVDYKYGQQQDPLLGFPRDECRLMFGERCIVH